MNPVILLPCVLKRTLLIFVLSLSTQLVLADLDRADQWYAEKSYALAAQAYEAWLANHDAPKAQIRAVSFKWADSVLRSENGAKLEEAYETLKTMANGEQADRWRIDSGVSLSHYHIDIRRDAWSHQQEIVGWLSAARSYWAEATDITLARGEFIEVSFMLADFIVSRWGWHARPESIDHPPQPRLPAAAKSLPLQPAPTLALPSLTVIYQEILAVAKTDAVRARAYYGLGMVRLHSQNGSDENTVHPGILELERVADDFGDNEWVDDALYQLGRYFANQEDYVAAVKKYTEFLERFKQGASTYRRNVEYHLKGITAPRMHLGVHSAFVPGSQIKFSLNWRNLPAVTMAIYPINLVDALKHVDENRLLYGYKRLIQSVVTGPIKRGKIQPLKQWKVSLTDEKKHKHHAKAQGLADWLDTPDEDASGTLPVGAYVLLVKSETGDLQAQELILISDIALLSTVSTDKAVIYAMKGETGEPVPNAIVSYAYFYHDRGMTKWQREEGRTDDRGLLEVAFKGARGSEPVGQRSLFATVTADDRQAFVENRVYRPHMGGQGAWWLYPFTDRPAYRPGETIQFKALLRQPQAGEFHTPSKLPVRVRIMDAQGREVYSEPKTLNEFGALQGELTLDEEALLGEYRIRLYDEGGKQNLVTKPLFRLEAYKLPEFLVSVEPKKTDAQAKKAGYRLGETFELTVSADYYFGGPVAEGTVEYLVYERPYQHYFRPQRPYQWYYDQSPVIGHYHPFYSGKLITQQKVALNGEGQATLKIETPKDSKHDLVYAVEVRVVDKSRREIRAQQSFKVTRHAFFAHMEPSQYLYRPGDRVRVSVRTLTANEQPYPTQGKITVVRKWWKARNNGTTEKKRVAASPDKSQPPQGDYEERKLLSRNVTTDETGQVTFDFEPLEPGYYEIRFNAADQGGEISQKSHVFVSDKNDHHIGYRYNGLEIILEKDTYEVGETARAMIVTDQPGAWVLLAMEADTLLSYQLLKLSGTVKLVELPITEQATPNLFLTAYSGENYLLKRAEQQSLVVPPTRQFLSVNISSDKLEYQPGETGTFDITVVDHNDKPVKAEVALGLVDSAIYAIQKEYVGDIREFFYGQKRPLAVRTQVSFYYQPYLNFERSGAGKLILTGNELSVSDENVIEAQERVTLRQPRPTVAASRVSESAAVIPEAQMRGQRAQVASKSSAVAPDPQAPPSPPVIREDFRSTVLWQPTALTDENGQVRVTVTFPDSLTTWRLTARAITQETVVGNVTHDVVSHKDLMVRLQAPRFFTQKDTVAISALIDNRTNEAMVVRPELLLEGLALSEVGGQEAQANASPKKVTVPAKGQARVDWPVRAPLAGNASITVSGQSKTASDGMKKSFTVIPHGIEKMLASSATLKSKTEQEPVTAQFAVDLPAARQAGSTQFKIHVSPSLAGNLLDALPYLAQFPYGCVEQTMSRFLPAVVVRKTLVDLGMKPADVNTYLENVLASRADPELPDQEEGAPRAETLSKLDEMTAQGLKRLFDFQQTDGGWGWWRTDHSDPFMTAYVLWGLSLARESELAVSQRVISRAQDFLLSVLPGSQASADRLAWLVHALAVSGADDARLANALDTLWQARDKLNAYSRALFALALHANNDEDRTRILAENMMNGVVHDAENGTAHWGAARGFYRWSEGAVEATAFSIRALSMIDPDHAMLAPAVKWLALNRRAGRWHNTRDTAIAILGLSQYLKVSKELSPDYTYSVAVNGELVRQGEVTPASVLSFNRFVDVPPTLLRNGENEISIQLSGEGALYASAFAKFFSLETPITAAAHEVSVTRRYAIQSAKQTLLAGVSQQWRPLKSGEQVKSGDRIRVEMVLDAKNDYEYLLVEDYKPAGAEAVALKSGRGSAISLDKKGEKTGRRLPLYQEFRDQKAAFFLSRLPQGQHVIEYELRAEVPGTFHAMPNQVQAMYVPEIRGNSDEMILKINDAP